MTSTPIHFYDAAESHNVPSGVRAAVYINGEFAWTEAEKKRMFAIFSISVEREAHWARQARCIDLEQGAGEPQDAVPFIRQRLAFGYHDGTVYVNRSNRGDVMERMHHAGLHPLEWVATLDGTDVPDAWACQIHGGMNAPFDVSILHGVHNLHRP